MRQSVSFTFILFHFLIIIAISSFSQNYNWGIKGGVNLGTPYGKAEDGATGSPGIGPRLGFFVLRKFNEKVDLQVEVLYSAKGGKYETPVSGDTVYEQVLHGVTYQIPTYYKGWVEGKFDNVYLDFPLLARYHPGEKMSFLIGAQVSYLLKGGNYGTADIEIGENYSKVYGEPFDESAYINQWDYSLILGGNYESNSGLNIDLGLSFGLRSLFKSSYDLIDNKYRNIYLYSTIGYRFGKGMSDIDNKN